MDGACIGGGVEAKLIIGGVVDFGAVFPRVGGVHLVPEGGVG